MSNINNFNPHSHEGSDAGKARRTTGSSYFNPHSHEGSDDDKQWIRNLAECISIHTPTKGVTRPLSENTKAMTISIHTPTKGVTSRKSKGYIDIRVFQSTLPRRE